MNVPAHIYRSFVPVFSLGLLALLPSPVFAATDGNKDTTSTGSANVNANVPAKVKITGLADFDFDAALATWDSGDLTESDTVCVWSSTEGYNVTISTGDGAFELVDIAATQTNVPYSVSWTDIGGAPAAVTYNTALNGQSTNAANQNCTGGDTATLAVTLSGADLEAARAADYTSTMTIVVASE